MKEELPEYPIFISREALVLVGNSYHNLSIIKYLNDPYFIKRREKKRNYEET